jgi:predicted nucleic acid-binding protein
VSGFLLDTNVVSMLSPSRAAPPTGFVDWLERRDGEGRVFLSVVTIHEIEKGVALLNHKGATAKAGALKIWLEILIAGYADRIVAIDAPTAALAGQMEAKAIAAGFAPGMADALIAGVARSNGLVVLTRDLKDFQHFGVAAASPETAVELP